MNGRTLTLLAEDVLDACLQAYNTTQDAPDRPQRMLVTHGTPVHDCEQLTVNVQAFKPVKPFPTQQTSALDCVVVPGVDLTIEVVRECWPTSSDVDEIQAAARLLASDASTLWTYIASHAVAGSLLPSFPTLKCGAVALGSLQPISPQGGVAGWRWPISVKLAIT